MLPPFLPFTARPLRRDTVKRSAVPEFLRDLALNNVRQVKAERLIIKAERLPQAGRLRILDR